MREPLMVHIGYILHVLLYLLWDYIILYRYTGTMYLVVTHGRCLSPHSGSRLSVHSRKVGTERTIVAGSWQKEKALELPKKVF
jgi:hypothetical protein